MITDPPQMPPSVIATALKDPLALTTPEGARATRSSSSNDSSSAGGCDGSAGSGVAGASGSGSRGRDPSPPKSQAPEASNDDEDEGEAAARALAALLVANQATAEAAAAALAERLVPSVPARPPEPEHDVSIQPSPASGPAAPAAAAASVSVHRAPCSLQDICCKVILRHISVHNCLELLGAVQGRAAPSLETIAAASLKYLVNSFEMLQGLRTEEELRAVLPAEVYDNLISAQEERAKAVAEMRRVGRAVERQAPPEDLGPVQVPSVTGRPISYPPEALKAGLIWPEGVQASDRETWLSEADFRLLFKGLSWEEFCKLPAWKKTGYKQDAGMF